MSYKVLIEHLEQGKPLGEGVGFPWSTLEAAATAIEILQSRVEYLEAAMEDIARQPEGDEQSAQAIAQEVLKEISRDKTAYTV
jgi:prefoldin subunit 5